MNSLGLRGLRGKVSPCRYSQVRHQLRGSVHNDAPPQSHSHLRRIGAPLRCGRLRGRILPIVLMASLVPTGLKGSADGMRPDFKAFMVAPKRGKQEQLRKLLASMCAPHTSAPYRLTLLTVQT